MEYLLVMSLSGSTMTGIYLIFRYLLRNKGCARSYYWFAKAAVLEPLQKEYKVKRRVIVYQGQDGEPTMTFGIFRPIILCGRPLESRDAELLIRHEMVHIKRWDIFWKVLMQLVTFLHWWNPIMWLLYRDFERVCEWSCDETAMQERPEEEVKAYLRLLIEEATDSGKSEKMRLRWKAGFGNNAKKLQERMDNLMKRRKWNKAAAGALVAVLAFANSMTAFAYRDTFEREIIEDVSQEEIEKTLDRDAFMFIPDEMEQEDVQDFTTLDELEIRYDAQFTDEEGNIYPITDPVQRGCSHTYVSGTASDHKKYSDGSCEVREYRAQRCSKCGYVLQGEQIAWRKYDVCPH